MDPKLEKFQIAKGSFFHWSVVANNKNPLAWLKWALIQQCIESDYNKAEKYTGRRWIYQVVTKMSV